MDTSNDIGVERIKKGLCPECGIKLNPIKERNKYEYYCPRCHPNMGIIFSIGKGKKVKNDNFINTIAIK